VTQAAVALLKKMKQRGPLPNPLVHDGLSYTMMRIIVVYIQVLNWYSRNVNKSLAILLVICYLIGFPGLEV
jgi:hypothetical protein